jgi:restriction endonuclease S subunit
MKIYEIRLSDIATHRDLRCGLGLILFRQVVSRLIGARFPSVRLGEILSLEYGKGLSDEERTGEGYPVVGSNGIVGYHDEYLIESPAIVVGRKGSAGEVTYLEQPCFPIDTTFYVQPKTDFFHPKILFYLLRLLNLQNLALFKGVPGLNRYDAYEAQIPLITRDVQECILRHIDPLERDIADLQARIAEPTEPINRVFALEFGLDLKRFEELKNQKVFTASLCDFANNPDLRCSVKFHREAGKFVEAELRRLSDKSIKNFLAEDIVLGATISPASYDDDGEYCYIAMSSIKTWKFKEEDARRVSEDYMKRFSAKSVKPADIIIARSGEGTIGKVAMIGEDVKGIFSDFTMRVRLKNYNPHFAYFYFCTNYFHYLVEIHKKGLGNNTNIFPVQIKEFPMLDIPTSRQEEIVAEIQTELAKRDEVEKQIVAKRSEIDRIVEAAISVTADDSSVMQ